MILPKRVWKNIEGYEELYQISNTKKVRKVKTGKIIKQRTEGKTTFIRLKKDGNYKRISVDKLYNQAFGFDNKIEDLEGEDLKNEIWKDVVGYEGLYEINNEKIVRKVKTGKIMKPMKMSNSIVVRLSKDGNYRRITLDKIYNQAFGFDNKIEDLEGEVWKDIEGYEGLYQVSNMGRVKSLRNNILMSPRDEGHGYYQVNLYKDGKSKMFRVHRLVAFAFIPNDDPINKNEVNHINEIRNDNRVENLEWCDRKYNVNYGTRTERQKQTCKENGIYEKALQKRIENGTYNRIKEGLKKSDRCRRVRCVELDMIFDSVAEASRFLGKGRVGESNISCCLRKIDNQEIAYGYHWEYVD